MMLAPEHSVSLGLSGLVVRRVEEDGSTTTVRITPIGKMGYRRVGRRGEYSADRWLPPKWFFKLLYLALRQDFTKFFFWATFLASKCRPHAAGYINSHIHQNSPDHPLSGRGVF